MIEALRVPGEAGCASEAAETANELARALRESPGLVLLDVEGADPASPPPLWGREGLQDLLAACDELARTLSGRRLPWLVRASGRISAPALPVVLDAGVIALTDGMVGVLPSWEDGPLLLPGTVPALVRRLGRARALEVALTGRPVTGAELAERGGASCGAEGERALSQALSGSRVAQAAASALLSRREAGRAEAEALERAVFALAMTAEDRTEGVRAFLEKRAPHFNRERA